MGNSEPMHHLLGKRGRSSGDDQRPGKRHRKAASSALRQDESSGEASNVAGSEEKDIEAAEAIQLLSADKVPVAAAVAKKASATAAGHQAEVGCSW